MPENGFEKLKTGLLAKLQRLNPDLTYHNINHTLEVMKPSKRMAVKRG